MTLVTKTPVVAFIDNLITPYRLQMRRRAIRQLREARFYSLFTHDHYDFSWSLPAEDIEPVYFGIGEQATDSIGLSKQVAEWRRAGRIIHWLTAHPISCLVCGGYGDLGRARLLLWARTHKIPSFVWGDSNVRCDTAQGWRKLLKTLVLPWLFRRCSGVLYCGRLGFEYFRKYGVPPEAMFQYPCEPDYTIFESVSESEIAHMRERFGLHAAHRYLIYVGRFLPWKRLDLLIDGFNAIADAHLNWDLIVVGDGEMRSQLMSLVVPSLRHRVIWTGFIENRHDLAVLYKCADVFVLPSDYEAWSVVLFEAAVSLALICSSVVGASPELVREGENGRTFIAGNRESLIDSLHDMLDESKLESRKASSRAILKRWQMSTDAVGNLRNALQSAGVLARNQAADPEQTDAIKSYGG